MSTTAIATTGASAPAPWFQPRNIQEALDLAQDIARSGLAPSSFGNDANKIFVAMVHGAELGLNAMQALQGIAVINGRPAVWGTTLMALVDRARIVKRRSAGCLPLSAVQKIRQGTWEGRTSANGDLIDALAVRIKDRLEQLEADKAKLDGSYQCGYAVFQVDDDIHVQLFDTVNAHRAGLLGKKGPWSDYPERMLRHRAVTYLARDTCSAALSGLAGQPTAEEVIDMDGVVDTTATDVTPPATVRQANMSTATPGAPQPPPEAPPQDAKATATARLRAAAERLKGLPLKDGAPLADEDRKVLINLHMQQAIGRTCAVSELTADERNALAAALEAIEPKPHDNLPTGAEAAKLASDMVASGDVNGLDPDDKTQF